MKAPTPPRELADAGNMELPELKDDIEVEQKETVEVILFEYEDQDVSFNISFEFVYSFKQNIDKEQVLLS